MSIYSRGVPTLATAAGSPIALFRSNTTRNMALLELTVVLAAATASSVGLIRSLTLGTAKAANTYLGQSEEANSAGSGSVITDWTVNPTIAGTPAYLRYVELPAAAGASLTWSWDPSAPLLIGNAATTALLLWNFGSGANSILDLTARWAEDSFNAQLSAPMGIL